MKPENISNIDWKILKEKYPNQMPEIIKKLEKNYPIQYLIGNVDFFDCHIEVNENVLIPRFETELLIEKTISSIKKTSISNPKIIDLGTGSGCIAIALKKNILCQMTAIDISNKALELAQKNAKINQTNITFLNEDMTKVNLEEFDIIVSNPPYVSENEEVGEETKYEPQNAIFANNKGLFFYESIIQNIENNRKKPQLIAFEIGMNQGKILTTIMQEKLPMYKIFVEKDYTEKDRFIFLEKQGE